MNELQAAEEIKLIRDMIGKTKQTAVDYWNIYICWGVVGILGVMGTYTLVFFKKYEWIWLNWIVFVGFGLVYTLLFVKKKGTKQRLKTHIYTSISHLSMACGVSFMLVGFVFPLLDLYSYGVIPVLISLVAGIFSFVEGGILEWNFLKICGIVWWLGASGMLFVKEDFRTLLFVPLLIFGYFVPFFLVKAEVRKKRV